MRKVFSQKAIISIALLTCIILVGSYYQPILIATGGYLAPRKEGKADVVILEGTELIREDAVRIGVNFLRRGVAGRLIVIYQHSGDEKIFARPSDYGSFLVQELEALGLKKEQIQVFEVPKGHPITLNEAKIVLSKLATNGVRSAILLSEGFHTRRSLWVYRQVGSGLGIEVSSFPYFMTYQNESWWQKAQGVREFFDESLKFFYYILRGYIPLKSLVAA